MKSKTRIVRYALIVRPIVVLFWKYTPKYMSKVLMSLFRNGESSVAFMVRYLCLKRLSLSCGEKVIVFPSVVIKNYNNLSVGNNVSIHEFTYIDSFGGISVGDDVAISHCVSIISFDHDVTQVSNSYKDSSPIGGQISIEDNVWIGAGSRILKGVTIESGGIVGAGSVVTNNCPAYTVCCGVPAKPIKEIFNHNSQA